MNLKFYICHRGIRWIVRFEIYSEAILRIDNYREIILEVEEWPMLLREYFNRINIPGFFEGELEISIASQNYDVNIAA